MEKQIHLSNIDEVLHEKRLSRADLARKTGITAGNITRMIKTNTASLNTLITVCDALEVPLYFMFLDFVEAKLIQTGIVSVSNSDCEEKIKELQDEVISLQRKIINLLDK